MTSDENNQNSSELSTDVNNDNGDRSISKTEADEDRYHTIMEKDQNLDPIDNTLTNSVTKEITSDDHHESDTNKEFKNSGQGENQGLPSLDVIYVQHECFGKAWGQMTPKLYTSPESKCIKCIECCKYYLN